MFLKHLKFAEGEDEVVLQFQHRQSVEKQMKFKVEVMSMNYPNMDLKGEINVDVLAPTPVTVR